MGTDTLVDGKLANRQGKQLAKMVRSYSQAEALIMATSKAELLPASGPRGQLHRVIEPKLGRGVVSLA